MITFKEYIQNNQISDIPLTHQHNIEEFLKLINIVREKYGKPMTVSSGYRSAQKQKDIYRAKGVPDNKIPWGSGHLKGQAIDFADSDGAIDQWCNENQDFLEKLGLWQEAPSSTKGWCHLDCLIRDTNGRPGLLKRQFNP